jgi:hypothetical protein
MLAALITALLLSGPAAKAAPPAMPPDVVAHYRDYNFVNAFSSASERRLLAKSATLPADSRLAQVARALARLADQTEELDPGIVLQDHAYGGRPRHESEFRSGVVRVTSWNADDAKGEAWVELEVLVLGEGAAGLFVASYERLTQGGKSVPDIDPDTFMVVTGRLPMRSVERHRWQHIDGAWRRVPVVLHLTSH